MALAFYFGLRRRGVEVLTAQEDGHDGLPDDEIMDRALVLGRLVVTLDADYTVIAADRLAQGDHFAGIVFIPNGGLSMRMVIDDIELIAKAGDRTEFDDRVTYLPL